MQSRGQDKAQILLGVCLDWNCCRTLRTKLKMPDIHIITGSKPLFHWKCLANEQEKFHLINSFRLALLACHCCYKSVITLNMLFLGMHQLAGW